MSRSFDPPSKVTVGMGNCGVSLGAAGVRDALVREMKAAGLDAPVVPVGCSGDCWAEIIVEVFHPDGIRITYGGITSDKVPALVAEHLVGGTPLDDWVVSRTDLPGPWSERQSVPGPGRIVTGNCGVCNPEEIDDYLAMGGYAALRKALDMLPEQVVEEVSRSGLRGRGGAGFPTGLKWGLARRAPGAPKYAICNAEEGEPGTFKDRLLLEGDPHLVLEGLTIAGFAVGANQGFIFLRHDYHLAAERLRRAMAQAEERGFLGGRILGTGFAFRIEVVNSPGSYVCGEESALFSSMEGKRGNPRAKPPFPAQKGYLGQPTVVNNVETLATIPAILERGAAWYRRTGGDRSPGTKIFCLIGNVVRPGAFEAGLGLSLSDAIYRVGGGIQEGRPLKLVQVGGMSGGLLPADRLDVPLDFEPLAEAGGTIGTGSILAADDRQCPVDLARRSMQFFYDQSCGKCTPCREGTTRMLQILDRLAAGAGRPGDLRLLERLGRMVKEVSLCGLGQAAPNPVLSGLRYFREEYEEHFTGRGCRAGKCGIHKECRALSGGVPGLGGELN